MKNAAILALAVLSALATPGCMGPEGDTLQEMRDYTHNMREEALAALYEKDPHLEQEVEKSVGYAVFSNFSLHPGLLSIATGFGVLTNKATGVETHSKWHRLTVGPGIAVKGMYILAVFHDLELLETFEKGRWTAGGQVEAALKFGGFGGGFERAWLFKKGVDVHYMTHTGVALELELIGVGRLSENSELNEAAETR